jgi:hypothetical protein
VNGLVRRLLAEVPDRLQEGGFAHVVCHWAHRQDQEWWEPIHPWVVGRGCDAWLLHFSSDDPAQYADRWNRNLQDEHPRLYRRTIRRWTEWYRQQGIERITGAGILFRRRSSDRNWLRGGTTRDFTTGEASDQLLRMFHAHDYLSTLEDPRRLLADRFRLSDGARLNLGYRVTDGKPGVQEAELGVIPGLGVLQSLSGELGERIFHLGGQQSLEEVIQAVASARGVAVEEVEGEYLPMFRRLYGFGMLDRAGAEGPAR